MTLKDTIDECDTYTDTEFSEALPKLCLHCGLPAEHHIVQLPKTMSLRDVQHVINVYLCSNCHIKMILEYRAYKKKILREMIDYWSNWIDAL
jgi:hypothetical protein